MRISIFAVLVCKRRWRTVAASLSSLGTAHVPGPPAESRLTERSASKHHTADTMVRIKSKELLEVSRGFLAPSKTPRDFHRVLVLQSFAVVTGLVVVAVNFLNGTSTSLNTLAFPLALYACTIALGWFHVGLYFRIVIVWAVAFFVLFLRRCVVLVTADSNDEQNLEATGAAATLSPQSGDEFAPLAPEPLESAPAQPADQRAGSLLLALPQNATVIVIAVVGAALSALGAVVAARVLRRRRKPRGRGPPARRRMTDKKIEFLKALAKKRAAAESGTQLRERRQLPHPDQ